MDGLVLTEPSEGIEHKLHRVQVVYHRRDRLLRQRVRLNPFLQLLEALRHVEWLELPLDLL